RSGLGPRGPSAHDRRALAAALSPVAPAPVHRPAASLRPTPRHSKTAAAPLSSNTGADMPSIRFSFRPRLFDCLKGYRADTFAADLGAGFTVGLVALPLAMAFAIASGVKPESGIFTAIIAGFLISALGGSRVQIGGPAGAFIVIIYGIIQQYGLANLL